MVAPLSAGKALIIVECLNLEGCERPDIMEPLSEVLDLRYGPGYDEWDDFLDYGFLLIEGEMNDANLAESNLLIDYLRNEKFRELIQADLFIDGVHVASSWEGNPDLWAEAPRKNEKAVVLRFPVEKIKRRQDPTEKN
jgi:hypothetical protein